MGDGKNTFTKNILFKPSLLRQLKYGTTKIDNITLRGDKNKTQGEETSSNTGSFRYDPSGYPLKSTQQLNVDWSKWENHTFFNSAQVKVQTAFDKIINHYPFDGTKGEYLEFIDSLTGYEKHVLNIFPKNKGSLMFTGSNIPGSGSYLSVNDYQGSNTIPGKLGSSGKFKLDFGYLPFTVETHVFIPSGSINSNQIILQKLSGSTNGLTLAVSSSESNASPEGSAEIHTYLSLDSVVLSASMPITKGEFHHVVSVYDRNDSGKLRMYLDGKLYTTSSKAAVFDDFDFQTEPVVIGSGTVHSVNQFEFTPTETLSGSLDEMRLFLTKRSDDQIVNFGSKTIFHDKDSKLNLYFKFNEPSGSFGTTTNEGNQNLVLDYSGNGLHTAVTNFDMSLRKTGSLPAALVSEDVDLSPVLFPSYESVISLGTELLLSGSRYDYNNPNLITNLVPKHYFLEASEAEGFESEFGDISQDYGYSSDYPGKGKMRPAQIISSLLYIWAETFDELKMFIDEFGRSLNVDYLSERTISDQLLPFLAKYYGLNLPNAYATANMMQLDDKENIRLDKTIAAQGLQGIQNTIWRRVLTALPELIKSKGTRYSIEALFRNMGINPNGGAFRIREYGGSKTKSISDSYEKRNYMAAMLDFSGSLSDAGTLDGSGKDSNRPLIQSLFLSSSRVEPGTPLIKGEFNSSGLSDYSGDGLFTSGSWTVEGLFKLDSSTSHPNTQSLMRLQTTGTQRYTNDESNNWLIFNTVAISPDIKTSKTGSISLFGRPVSGALASTLEIILTGVNVFDGKKWHVSFGRTRNDQASSYVSSSYFLRAGRMGDTSIEEFYTTSSYYDDSGDNVLNRMSGSNNASGTFVVVGSQSLSYDTSLDNGFLNTITSDTGRFVNFTGKSSGIRFFSKALTENETLTHIKNFKSVGVENPEVNYSFNVADSGSYERLRLDLFMDQPDTKSNATGEIEIFDFSQNNLHASGSGFEVSKEVVKPERFDYLILSPRFELSTNPNKIRIRSFQQTENIKQAGLSFDSFAPMYSIPENEKPSDDRRLSIEVSSVQALNEDIVNIFSTLNALDSAIGNPELVFSQEYRSLRNLRKVYFNRLDQKISLTKFFEFFKWFDQTVGGLIEELVPSSTRYLGTNFIVESHALERPKFTYQYHDAYVGVLDRREASVIFLQQFLGDIRKF